MPSYRPEAIEELLTKISGDSRQDAANELRCINPPIGCGQPIKGFRDLLSQREHRISGLCQKCQDAFFNEEEE